ncbi:helix-turn-helix domain-containing protein [Neobacillus bataviensis]|uniref:helix-turn-helix domain-containing protein n=1 Tax=Neobacillus bataviensis TaxID=220685 RepID=UPI001CBBBCF9|nr:helix-turn-helix transcriptional regulator [Neobacillus bataviensis]
MTKEKINYFLGDAIRPLRQAKGLTQEQLAENSKLNRTYMVDLETKNVNPSFYTIYKIAIGLGIPVEELVKRIADNTDIDRIFKEEPY